MNWGPFVGDVGPWLRSLFTGVVATSAAWGLFQWLGKRWVEDKFAKELEAFRSEKRAELEKLRTEYGRETERLKADLNRFADRASRFHTREYEVLPEAWGLMSKAFGAASSATAVLQQHADLNRMGRAELEAWLERSELEQYQKDELKAAADKNKIYITLKNWKQIGSAEKSVMEFTNYLIIQGIFISEPLSDKMMGAGNTLRLALISKQIAEEARGKPYISGETNYHNLAREEVETVAPLVLEVKRDIQRLLSDIRLTTSGQQAND